MVNALETALERARTENRILSEMGEQLHERFLAVESAGGDIGLRSGVAHVKPDVTLTAEGFLGHAEQALREAKRQERDWAALWQGTGRRQGSL